MERLNQNDIEWMFAIKDNMIKEYYQKNYGVYEGEPSDRTLYALTAEMVDKTNSWKDIIKILDLEHYTIAAIKGKDELSMHEWLFYGIKAWCKRRTVKWLEENAEISWKQYVKDFRKKYDNDNKKEKK